MKETYPEDQERSHKVTLSEGSWTPLAEEAWHYGYRVLALNLVRGSHACGVHSHAGGGKDPR